ARLTGATHAAGRSTAPVDQAFEATQTGATRARSTLDLPAPPAPVGPPPTQSVPDKPPGTDLFALPPEAPAAATFVGARLPRPQGYDPAGQAPPAAPPPGAANYPPPVQNFAPPPPVQVQAPLPAPPQ